MPSWLDLSASSPPATASGSQALVCLLDSQAILSIKGEDAAKFLQGQCTADVSRLLPGDSTLGAICTNKGRVISNFRVVKTPDALLLRMSADLATDTLEKIKKYAVFFKVDMQIWPVPSVAVLLEAPSSLLEKLPEGVYAAPAENASVELYAEPDRANELLDFLATTAQFTDELDWHKQQIRAGLTNINICTTEGYLPHQLNLDKTEAISFTKGCYTGQEIVARTQYKGKTKRRVLPVSIDVDLGDLHNIELHTDDEVSQQIEILDAVKESDSTTIAALLLPVDFPQQGNLLVNGKEVAYERLPLPFEIEA